MVDLPSCSVEWVVLMVLTVLMVLLVLMVYDAAKSIEFSEHSGKQNGGLSHLP